MTNFEFETYWEIDRENARATHKVNGLVVEFVSMPISEKKIEELDARRMIASGKCWNDEHEIEFGIVAAREDLQRILELIRDSEEDPTQTIATMLREAGQAWVDQFNED